jgi:hypothetical protein
MIIWKWWHEVPSHTTIKFRTWLVTNKRKNIFIILNFFGRTRDILLHLTCIFHPICTTIPRLCQMFFALQIFFVSLSYNIQIISTYFKWEAKMSYFDLLSWRKLSHRKESERDNLWVNMIFLSVYKTAWKWRMFTIIYCALPNVDDLSRSIEWKKCTMWQYSSKYFFYNPTLW